MSRVNAVRIHRNGGSEELRHEEIEIGDPGPGEARVQHRPSVLTSLTSTIAPGAIRCLGFQAH